MWFVGWMDKWAWYLGLVSEVDTISTQQRRAETSWSVACTIGSRRVPGSASPIGAVLAVWPTPSTAMPCCASPLCERCGQCGQLHPPLLLLVLCRRRVGEAGREEVCLWDWRAATLHLLNYQYPLAVAAAQAYYGKRSRQAQQGFGSSGGSGGASAVPVPVAA